MVFSSVAFLFLFLPLTLAAYFAVPKRFRNPVLLVANLVFYTWGGGAFVFLLLFTVAVNWIAGLIVARGLRTGSTAVKQAGIAFAVLPSLLLLSYFKYANFLVDQLNAASGSLGWGNIAWTSVALPIGISFYTFQALSYTIDVSRGRTEALRNPFYFVMFVTLFPHAIAGPIVRFHEIAPELENRTTRLQDFAEGAIRFTWGLCKKVIIADTIAPIADAAFDPGVPHLSAAGAWLGVFAFAVQIYFDFSGYSDMAIGMARMLGFHFPENFKRPYSSLSITDFWRRWHITLSNWFRDYLYVPLGGNRGSERRTAFNLLVVFAATGVWHGASWTFLLWGLYYGAFLIWERYRGTRYVESAPREWLARSRTFLIVLLGWVLFRAVDISDAFAYFGAMLGLKDGLIRGDIVLRSIDLWEVGVFAVGALTLFLPRDFFAGILLSKQATPRAGAARAALLIVGLPFALLLVVSQTFSPFLYFQF